MYKYKENFDIDLPTTNEDLCNLNWIRSKKWPFIKVEANRQCSLVDLFSGCGGLSLGVWEAMRSHGYSINIQMALDISSYALEVYQNNFKLSDSKVVNDDIAALLDGTFGKKLNKVEAKLRDQFIDLDILVAGPPCQGHSDLNNQTRRKDPRNALYLKVIRFAEITKPKIILIENVSTVIHDKGEAVNQSQKALEALGYFTKEILINTLDFGLPQKRKRHILLGILSQDYKNSIFEIPTRSRETNLSEYIWDLIDEYQEKESIFNTPSGMSEENQKRVQYLFDNDLYNLPNKKRPTCHKDKKHSYISMYGRLHWEKPAQTITSGFGSMGQGRFIHPSRKRVITPHEAARIQGFPDFYDFTSVKLRTALHEMIGNAVPPIISATLISRLLKEKFI